MSIDSTSVDLAEVRRIVLEGLKGYAARVYLFGSWAKGNASLSSDIDVAVMPEARIPRHVFSEIRELLDESRVIHEVDLIDLSETSADFRERVEQEGLLWTD